MPTDQRPLAERVATSYSQLSTAAKDLNNISDELGKSIVEIDSALKRLNLGVVVWVPVQESSGLPDDSWYWSEDIGYAKIGTTWGIGLRRVDGDFQRPDEDAIESWLFNDAPRALRISAIEKIPDLLEKLSAQALKTTNEIRARLSDAQAVAAAVKGAAVTPRIPLRVPLSPSTFSKTAADPTQGDVDPVAGGQSIETTRKAVIAALGAAGQASASTLLETSEWTASGSGIRIAVPGIGKKMLALTVNAAAEKTIREELLRLGTTARFMVIPGEPSAKIPGATPDLSSHTDATAGVEK